MLIGYSSADEAQLIENGTANAARLASKLQSRFRCQLSCCTLALIRFTFKKVLPAGNIKPNSKSLAYLTMHGRVQESLKHERPIIRQKRQIVESCRGFCPHSST